MLNDPPKLRSLKLKSKHNFNYNDPMTLWEEPAVVPKCLSEHLEILEWRQYEGTEQERNVAGYILAHAACLMTAKFSTERKNKYQRIRMLGKLESMGRVSGKLAFFFLFLGFFFLSNLRIFFNLGKQSSFCLVLNKLHYIEDSIYFSTKSEQRDS